MREKIIRRALELIRKQPGLRSPRIAQALDLTAANVEELLRPEVDAGRLLACTVDLADHGRVMERRVDRTGVRA